MVITVKVPTESKRLYKTHVHFQIRTFSHWLRQYPSVTQHCTEFPQFAEVLPQFAEIEWLLFVCFLALLVLFWLLVVVQLCVVAGCEVSRSDLLKHAMSLTVSWSRRGEYGLNYLSDDDISLAFDTKRQLARFVPETLGVSSGLVVPQFHEKAPPLERAHAPTFGPISCRGSNK